jgi:hypothetical protein
MIKDMKENKFVKVYRGKTVYINEDPDRSNPYASAMYAKIK